MFKKILSATVNKYNSVTLIFTNQRSVKSTALVNSLGVKTWKVVSNRLLVKRGKKSYLLSLRSCEKKNH